MAGSPPFEIAFEPRHGEAVRLSPLVRRLTVNNPGPFTFHGTNTYLVGERQLAIVDPGPEDEAHFAALLAAIGSAEVAAILVTHTHRDHSPLAARLKRATGARVYAEGPHRPARPLALGEVNPLDASADLPFRPDVVLADGDRVAGDGWTFEAILTPGHTANHVSFALAEEEVVFSGDHVMAWSTSIVAPPDGAMGDYMASLDRMIARPERRYHPGHGGPVDRAPDFTRALKMHRLQRERAILDLLARGEKTIPELVAVMYANVDARLHGAAALSVLAHLEELGARGATVAADGPPFAVGYRLRP